MLEQPKAQFTYKVTMIEIKNGQPAGQIHLLGASLMKCITNRV